MPAPSSILLVDDNEDDRFLTRIVISEAFPEAHLFEMEDGDRALDFFQTFDEKKNEHGDLYPPLLVLLDINMPLMDGFEFLEAYEKLAEGKGQYDAIQVMMLTTSDNEEDRNKAFTFKTVKDFLNKPMKSEDIRKVITDYF